MKKLLTLTRGEVLVRLTLQELAERECRPRMLGVKEIKSRDPGRRRPVVVRARDAVCYAAALEGYQDYETAAFLGMGRSSVTYAIGREVGRGRLKPAEAISGEVIQVLGHHPRVRRSGNGRLDRSLRAAGNENDPVVFKKAVDRESAAG